MMSYFEEVIDGFLLIGSMIGILLIYAFYIITIPIWIVPYLIYKSCKNRAKKGR